MDACLGCGNGDPLYKRHIKEKFTGKYFDECERCCDSSVASNPDVYFKAPYWDANIHMPGDPGYDPDRGTFVTSKVHKAYLLKKMGCREAGDRHHGSNGFDPITARHAEESLRRNYR